MSALDFSFFIFECHTISLSCVAFWFERFKYFLSLSFITILFRGEITVGILFLSSFSTRCYYHKTILQFNFRMQRKPFSFAVDFLFVCVTSRKETFWYTYKSNETCTHSCLAEAIFEYFILWKSYSCILVLLFLIFYLPKNEYCWVFPAFTLLTLKIHYIIAAGNVQLIKRNWIWICRENNNSGYLWNTR